MQPDGERVRQSMTNPRKLTSEESAHIAKDPPAVSLSLAGGGRTAILRPRDGSAPKKRRKMSAAWKTMIAVTTKARREKGE